MPQHGTSPPHGAGKGTWDQNHLDVFGSDHMNVFTWNVLCPIGLFKIKKTILLVLILGFFFDKYISARSMLVYIIPLFLSFPAPHPGTIALQPLPLRTRYGIQTPTCGDAVHLSASIPSPSPSPHGLNLILPGRGTETPRSRSQLRPVLAPGLTSNQGRPSG